MWPSCSPRGPCVPTQAVEEQAVGSVLSAGLLVQSRAGLEQKIGLGILTGDRPFERVLGDCGKEKPNFNRNKPPAEPG